MRKNSIPAKIGRLDNRKRVPPHSDTAHFVPWICNTTFKPSNLRSSSEVRSDALYYTAIAYRDIYISDASPDNRGLALQAWLVVKNVYRNSPNHPRYQKAVEELAGIK